MCKAFEVDESDVPHRVNGKVASCEGKEGKVLSKEHLPL